MGDPSLNYVHDYEDYMRLITQQVYVTEKGRVYLVERVGVRCGNLFMKYVYCEFMPMNKSVEMVTKFWVDDVDRMVIMTWEFQDNFFVDSCFSTKKNPIVSFKRKFIEVDKRFFDLLYGHCLRSGEKSFNLNEVFSAALTFNTRMSINGNDVRVVNRVPSGDLLDVVVAVYCIAYKNRFNAGKCLERFVSDEKLQRSGRNLGLVDFMRVLEGDCE